MTENQRNCTFTPLNVGCCYCVSFGCFQMNQFGTKEVGLERGRTENNMIEKGRGHRRRRCRCCNYKQKDHRGSTWVCWTTQECADTVRRETEALLLAGEEKRLPTRQVLCGVTTLVVRGRKRQRKDLCKLQVPIWADRGFDEFDENFAAKPAPRDAGLRNDKIGRRKNRKFYSYLVPQ